MEVDDDGTTTERDPGSSAETTLSTTMAAIESTGAWYRTSAPLVLEPLVLVPLGLGEGPRLQRCRAGLNAADRAAPRLRGLYLGLSDVVR